MELWTITYGSDDLKKCEYCYDDCVEFTELMSNYVIKEENNEWVYSGNGEVDDIYDPSSSDKTMIIYSKIKENHIAIENGRCVGVVIFNYDYQKNATKNMVLRFGKYIKRSDSDFDEDREETYNYDRCFTLVEKSKLSIGTTLRESYYYDDEYCLKY